MAVSRIFVWSWSLLPPFAFVERISVQEYTTRKKTIREYGLHPPEPHTRKAYWEGFPSMGAWSILGINARYKFLRQLDGSGKHVEVLQGLSKSFSEGKDATNIIIALFAGIGAALLAVPGIETSHWITRAFFFAATLLTIGGVIIGAMLPRLFSLFFGEDIDVNSKCIKNENNMLTWQNHRELLHGICGIFAYQTSSITFTSIFLVAGIFAFSITADFSTDATPTSSKPLQPVFAILSLGPFVLYMTFFWNLLGRLSVRHRRARGEMIAEIVQY